MSEKQEEDELLKDLRMLAQKEYDETFQYWRQYGQSDEEIAKFGALVMLKKRVEALS